MKVVGRELSSIKTFLIFKRSLLQFLWPALRVDGLARFILLLPTFPSVLDASAFSQLIAFGVLWTFHGIYFLLVAF